MRKHRVVKLSKKGIEFWLIEINKRVRIKKGNKAGTILINHTFNPFKEAWIHRLGLSTNKKIVSSNSMVNNIRDLVFNILYTMNVFEF